MEFVADLPRGLRQAMQVPQTGLVRARVQVGQAAARIAREGPAVEPAVDLLRGQHYYAANAKVLRTMDQQLGTLLDTLA